MTNRQKQILVCSARNTINKAKINGILDMSCLDLYRASLKQLEYIKNTSGLENSFDDIQDSIIEQQYGNDNITNDIPAVLPDYPFVRDSNDNPIPSDNNNINNPIIVASNIVTSNIVQENIFGVGNLYDTYKFTIADFENAYSDNNNGDFYSIRIDRSDLDGLTLKRQDSPSTGNIFGENSSSINILKADIPKWSLLSTSNAQYIHSISFKIIDYVNGVFIESNTATLTVNRTSSQNQPATIGDITISVGNRAVTVFTLAMFTSQLTPPYNDPENDLIDAIRIDEISTANKGTFYLNGVPIVENQIITREDIVAGLFTHESANQNDIWSDAFEWSARDEGSKIWIN